MELLIVTIIHWVSVAFLIYALWYFDKEYIKNLSRRDNIWKRIQAEQIKLLKQENAHLEKQLQEAQSYIENIEKKEERATKLDKFRITKPFFAHRNGKKIQFKKGEVYQGENKGTYPLLYVGDKKIKVSYSNTITLCT